MSAEPERLEAILGALPIDDALWLAARLEPPWAAQRRRLNARDAAIREVWEQLTGNATVRSEELARRLKTYIRTDFLRDKPAGGPPAYSSPTRHLLYRIVSLNDGGGLEQRQISRIANGVRTPPMS